jgi:hypothetical protein
MTAPPWLDDMRKAKVPHQIGMLMANGLRILWLYPNGAVDCCPAAGERRLVDGRGPLWVPDLADRATFLLCLDEAEKRGIRELFDEDGAYFASIDAGDARALYMWADDLARPLLIRALARALRETAPGGGR